MPNTRKKVIKTVYKDEASDDEPGDFSDSGSDAQISEPPSSDDEEIDDRISSADEFDNKSKQRYKQPLKRKPKHFAKEFFTKVNKQIPAETEENDIPIQFSVKDLTDADKLLPSILNLSESDSSDDEEPRSKKSPAFIQSSIIEQDESDSEDKNEYTDVWANTIHDNSAEIAKKTFMELEQHKTTIEQTKATIQNYIPSNIEREMESNVTDLLALGEEVAPQKSPTKKKRITKRVKNDSDSEVEDWEEVKESKAIPQQGLQLVVALPDSVCRKSKKVDVEMMMKRKINRVKKEHQVFIHKVHVLCWIGHGNYVSKVLNDQEIMAAVLAMVPQGCYPDHRLDMKYIEQITTWFKDKLTLRQEKHENKFKPKAPPLQNILLDQIKQRTVTAGKYSVFIFVAMLRALGLQCRVMFNFVTAPLKPQSSELCSLSTKPKDENINKKEGNSKTSKSKPTNSKTKAKSNEKIPQIDGIDDSFLSSDSDFENIMQVDGNDDSNTNKTRSLRTTRIKKVEATNDKDDEGVSPPKRAKKKAETNTNSRIKTLKTTAPSKSPSEDVHNGKDDNTEIDSVTGANNAPLKTTTSIGPKSRKSPQRSTRKCKEKDSVQISNTKESEQNVESIVTTKTPTASKSPESKPKKDISGKVSSTNNNEQSPNKTKNANADTALKKTVSPRKTRSNNKTTKVSTIATKTTNNINTDSESQTKKGMNIPKIMVTDQNNENTSSIFFANAENSTEEKKRRSIRKRSHTAVAQENQTQNTRNTKTRTKSAPGRTIEKSKYFEETEVDTKRIKLSPQQQKKQAKLEDAQRVSHRDLLNSKTKAKSDVTGDLVNIIKDRIKVAKEESKKGIVKGKVKQESDEDSDYLPVEDPKHNTYESDEDFKPSKISPKAPKLSLENKPSSSKKKIDRRVLSSDDEATNSRKVDLWCEIFVEELEQWIAVDVIKGKVHCAGELYSHATHPVCYVVGWDNNNYLKDLTRRYVPHWNTVTRKQRAEPLWWKTAIEPWLGPKNARDKEEDEALDRMQLEAPLPKSIAEYKNHPLYALKRHLLKFEAIYPPDAATLGFVRNEPVYARECVYVCRSRDTWLKEAKVVKFGERPYKVVKARPKWDKLSNKLITDKPLEVFGPWQVQDYEPPTAKDGVVPRNAYGNVELFKECMLPKGTVHIKLPGLNKVARKLNIDCAPAMTGFDFNGGWSHPVYDGFVVCQEFEQIITAAWLEDQEEQERREQEKMELRVYGNWKRLIKGLLIRERLKNKYGFEKPSTSEAAKNKKGPRLVCKKKP